MPVIVETTGNVIKELKKYLETIRGKHSTDSVQKKKTAVLGTSLITRKVLQSETGSLSNGVHRWFKGRSTRRKEYCDKR
jgi:hypothetical protein